MKPKLYAVTIGERKHFVKALTKAGAVKAVTKDIQVEELDAIQAVDLMNDQDVTIINAIPAAPGSQTDVED